MKKFVALALVAAFALAIPASAGAKGIKITSTHYTGTVSPAGTVGFNYVRIKKRHKKPRFQVGAFTFAGVPVNCTGGPKATRGQVTFGVPVLNGAFSISASATASGSSLAVTGNVFSGAGTIQVDGNSLPLDPSGTGTNCHSGVLNWTAHVG